MEHLLSHSGASPAQAATGDIAAFLDLSPLPAIVIDRDYRIVDSNPAARQFLVYEMTGLKGIRFNDIVRAAEPGLWLDRPNSTDEDQSGPCEFICSDGTSAVSEVHGRSLPDGGWLILINDISGRKKIEKSLLASEKQRWKMQRTEALEKLAGGIAHEFNNILAVILLQTDMMNLQLQEGSPLVNRVSEIRAVANDAASIVRQLLAFGRRQAMKPAPVVLNNLLATSRRDLRALLGDKIELVLDLEADLGVSFVDAGQIAQALMYLVINARDAMPIGGTLTIKTRNIDRGGQRIHKTQASGPYIQVEVIDTGVGMDQKTEDHVFEPFFSSKGEDKSTGLSLATVYGIIKQSGGYIWVTSVQKAGTTFKIQFPRIDQPKAAATVSAQKNVRVQMQTILLVDDEISIRKVAAEALRQAGYRVLEAANGMDAVDIARTFPDPIHLVLADYSMPVMNGVEAAKRIKQFHADARVLLMSGDPGTFSDDNRLGAATEFLSKPFTLAGLTKMVTDLLAI